MSWESPSFLLALWMVPAIGLLAVYSHRRRQAVATRFARRAMLIRLVPRLSLTRLVIKSVLLMVAVTLLIVAAARPRFGVYFDEVRSRGVDVFILLDVSRSMLADDVKPNRLERAKSDILDLIENLPDDRVGLIAFAGAPAVLVPLTTDRDFFRMVLRDVNPDSAPRGGSLIGDAIRKAITSLPVRNDRDQALVIITDGEDQQSFPTEAAQQAAERNLRIITVGLGDVDEGSRIPTSDDDGSRGFIRHEGQEVWSKMDEALLKEIALTTSGAYVPARTRNYDLGEIYRQHLASLSTGDLTGEQRRRFREQFQWFGIAGLLLLVIELFIGRSTPPATNSTEPN